jgi:hypothetical protein
VGRPWPAFTWYFGDLTVADEIQPVAVRVQPFR